MRDHAARLALGVLAAGAALAGPAAALLASQARPDRPVLVVAPPWLVAEDVVRAAGGRPVGLLSAPMATLAQGGGPDFLDRLRAAGGWFALDGERAAAICGASR